MREGREGEGVGCAPLSRPRPWLPARTAFCRYNAALTEASGTLRFHLRRGEAYKRPVDMLLAGGVYHQSQELFAETLSASKGGGGVV